MEIFLAKWQECSAQIQHFYAQITANINTENKAQAREALESVTKELESLSAQLDPLSTLTSLSLSNNFMLDGEICRPEIDRPLTLNQAHLEFLQAVFLKHKSTATRRQPKTNDLNDIVVLVRKTFLLVHLAFPPDESEDLKFLAGRSRLMNQSVRNWCYSDQMRAITKKVFEDLDASIEKTVGIRASSIVEIIFSLVDLLERRAEDAINEAIVVALSKNGPSSNEIDLSQLALDSKTIGRIFTFTISDFRNCCVQVQNEESVAIMLKKWSQGMGDLVGSSTSDFFLNNPVSKKPLIRLENGDYFCPYPNVLISSCFNLIEDIVLLDANIPNTRYFQARKKFLEEESKRLFEKAFPKGRCYSQVKWGSSDADRGNTDVVLLLEPFLIICEAKSHRPPEAAARGGVGSLKTSLSEVVTAPHEQASRFETWLKRNPGVHKLQCNEGICEIDTNKILKIMRINTNFAGSILHSLGWKLDATDSTPSIPINDLQCILELLPNQSQRLHFLLKRQEFIRNPRTSLDEIGLLALYLETGLKNHLDQRLIEELPILAYQLDPYLDKSMNAESISAPKQRISQWCLSLLTFLDSLDPQATALGLALLEAEYNENEILEERIRPLVEAIKNQPDSTSEIFIFEGSMFEHRIIIGLLACQRISEPQNWINNLAVLLAEEHSAQYFLLIAYDAQNQSAEPVKGFVYRQVISAQTVY